MPRAWHALAGYTAVAIVATWPLIGGLSRLVPWDLGDPVLVMWILAWDCEQLLAILGGDLARVATFFDAPMFHPAPLTLAYSEHLLAQAIQGLPVYALTRDPILTYNLLFLSTFALSGLGVFLFVRELTGDARAAFVAGLLFAFAPYRMPQGPHLQVLSAQWMPFALYGLRRYFDTGRARPLAGAAASLVALHHSSLYFMLYFAPFAAAYVLWELVQRGLWRRWQTLAGLAAAATAVMVLTVPLLLPYLAVRETLELGRTRGETIRYSADVYSYATAAPTQMVWGGTARAFPKPEGELFPGLTTLMLALLGLGLWRRETSIAADARPWLVWILRAALVLHLFAIAAVLLFRRLRLDLGVFSLSISDANQLLIRAAILAVLIALISAAARVRMRSFLRSRGFFVFALIAAAWLSLGPAPRSLGVPIELAAPYALLHEHVPGYDGLRVPARLATVVTLMLSVLAGFGACVIGSALASPGRQRNGRTAAVFGIVCALALAESVILPLPVEALARPARAPAAYHALAREPASTVVAELPLGEVEGDLRAMFFGLAHRRPVLNGYSGFFPPHYALLKVALSDVGAHPDIALAALSQQGATHVLVHEAAGPAGSGARTTAVLKERGAVEIFRDGADAVLRLPSGNR